MKNHVQRSSVPRFGMLQGAAVKSARRLRQLAKAHLLHRPRQMAWAGTGDQHVYERERYAHSVIKHALNTASQTDFKSIVLLICDMNRNLREDGCTRRAPDTPTPGCSAAIRPPCLDRPPESSHQFSDCARVLEASKPYAEAQELPRMYSSDRQMSKRPLG